MKKLRIIALPTIFFLLIAPAAAQRPSTPPTPQASAAALLAAALDDPILPPGSELAAVTVAGDAATVDLRLPFHFLRRELDAARSDAIVEWAVDCLHPPGLRRIHVRAADEQGRFLPLSDFLPALPDLDIQPSSIPSPDHVGQPPLPGQGRPQGALSGHTVWLSPGHGWRWDGSQWETQRPNTYGVIEDFSNAEAVDMYLAYYLWNAGADVWLVRERCPNDNEVVVDNDDGPPHYVESGAWITSTMQGYEGGTYRYAETDSTLSASAAWTPTIPAAGWYAVWAWYRPGENRPVDTRYQVRHAGGVTTVSISQEVHGLAWRYLGDYYFEAGTGGGVTLINESDDPGQFVIADAVRFGGGLGSIDPGGGTSGEPRWEEQALYYAQFQGMDVDGLNDVIVRPLYAEWELAKGYSGEDAVFVSWHTNCCNATGSESFIHDSEPTPGSDLLQDWVHAELINDLRGGWDPDWVDRGQKTANFGELRELITMPGVLLEVAFHDTEDPGDADDLKQPLFRQIAARAVYQGIVRYFADRDGETVHLLPEPPTRLVARNSGPGQVTLTWEPPPYGDGVVGDAATAYKVYHSDDGRGFDNGVEVVEPTLTVAGLAPGSLHFFRVTARNAGGESFSTPVVAARTPQLGAWVPFLVVDGFDRLDRYAMIPQWENDQLGTSRRMFLGRMNRYDYAVEHGAALHACQLPFDGATNEAVENDDVLLGDYLALDWIVGEDSTADAALSEAERARLAVYLDGGGRLLISGAEIGWHLARPSGGVDPDFYSNYLKAAYVGDDAETYAFVGSSGGPFDGLSGSFDDSSHGYYDVDYPDRMGTSGGSTMVIGYSGGTGDGAAIAYSGDFAVVNVGFPLETVIDPAVRESLICLAADYLLPPPTTGVLLAPNRSSAATPGQAVTYTHALTNSGNRPDVLALSHHSSEGWAVEYRTPYTLDAGAAATVVVTLTVPGDALSGTVDLTAITATSRADGSAWASVVDATTVLGPPNQAPYAPHSPHPADHDPDVPITTTLSWQGGDPDGDAVTYTVSFGDSDPPPIVAAGLTTPAYDPGPLAHATTYYWTIGASDGRRQTQGPTWQFTTVEESVWRVYLPALFREYWP
ncbi:MAG: fibronectin type III domain-containing protein [Anaerolineae bacterium]|nr:fibronectin type III domain-containing protein [Anaerolineae bacterium]